MATPGRRAVPKRFQQVAMDKSTHPAVTSFLRRGREHCEDCRLLPSKSICCWNLRPIDLRDTKFLAFGLGVSLVLP